MNKATVFFLIGLAIGMLFLSDLLPITGNHGLVLWWWFGTTPLWLGLAGGIILVGFVFLFRGRRPERPKGLLIYDQDRLAVIYANRGPILVQSAIDYVQNPKTACQLLLIIGEEGKYRIWGRANLVEALRQRHHAGITEGEWYVFFRPEWTDEAGFTNELIWLIVQTVNRLDGSDRPAHVPIL